MDRPADWDALGNVARQARRREALTNLLGAQNLWFQEDRSPVRGNAIIMVWESDYFGSFELAEHADFEEFLRLGHTIPMAMCRLTDTEIEQLPFRDREHFEAASRQREQVWNDQVWQGHLRRQLTDAISRRGNASLLDKIENVPRILADLRRDDVILSPARSDHLFRAAAARDPDAKLLAAHGAGTTSRGNQSMSLPAPGKQAAPSGGSQGTGLGIFSPWPAAPGPIGGLRQPAQPQRTSSTSDSPGPLPTGLGSNAAINTLPTKNAVRRPTQPLKPLPKAPLNAEPKFMPREPLEMQPSRTIHLGGPQQGVAQGPGIAIGTQSGQGADPRQLQQVSSTSRGVYQPPQQQGPSMRPPFATVPSPSTLAGYPAPRAYETAPGVSRAIINVDTLGPSTQRNPNAVVGPSVRTTSSWQSEADFNEAFGNALSTSRRRRSSDENSGSPEQITSNSPPSLASNGVSTSPTRLGRGNVPSDRIVSAEGQQLETRSLLPLRMSVDENAGRGDVVRDPVTGKLILKPRGDPSAAR